MCVLHLNKLTYSAVRESLKEIEKNGRDSVTPLHYIILVMFMIDIALKAALQAGEAILEIYKQDFEVEFKADKSPLTTADKASHRIIVQALEATPYPVLSEESAEIGYDDRKDWRTYWLVDPLDGTKEFIKKNDEFTVNIALIEEGHPVMGVVYAPVLQTIYYGSQIADMAQGAWRARNCKDKSVSEIMASATPCSIRHASCAMGLRVVASRSHCNAETQKFIADLERKYGDVELVSSGSSLKLCLVADGSADIYPRIAPTMEWDTAAAHAVVKAAGGEVFEYDENLSVTSYAMREPEGVEQGGSVPDAMRHVPRALRYNKENLLNPYFVASGIV